MWRMLRPGNSDHGCAVGSIVTVSSVFMDVTAPKENS